MSAQPLDPLVDAVDRGPVAADPVVLKFGSSVLRDARDLPAVVQEIYAELRRGRRIVAVVSAFAGVTDALYAAARAAGADELATAETVAAGEFESAAALLAELERCGVPARLLEPRTARLVTRGPRLDAEPATLDVAAFARAFATAPVLVFPGFCGVDPAGATTLLGRGGSDLTAAFLACRLDAHCALFKDVDGLYERDPAAPGPRPARYARVAWDEALRVAGRLVQPKTLAFAREHARPLELRALGGTPGTRIDAGPARLQPAAPRRPLRVALLGRGVVGAGVHARLAARPDLFELVAVAVRRPERHAGAVPAALLHTDPRAALAAGAEVVVEALGGVEPAADLLQEALESDLAVVTANKAALAARWADFARWIECAAPRLRASAAVGGAVPVLEAARRLAARRPVRVRGVLNGTCNFVLDRLEAGGGLAAAVAEAQAAGYAEPDPSFDLSGRDAAHKLLLLARTLGRGAVAESVEGLDDSTPARLRAAAARGRRLRLVATLDDAGARVALEALAPDDPLAGARAAENRVEFVLADGSRERLAGQGAGREPTATAVLADLLDLRAQLLEADASPSALRPPRAASA